MPKVYYPQKARLVDATGHAPGTQFKVSYGLEYWDETPHYVYKVQMVYNGVVSGRRSPSYLKGTDDFQRVNETMQEIMYEVDNNIIKPDDKMIIVVNQAKQKEE
ncbi:hypothetical protein [Paenibacillus sp. FSL K6-1318]|uniref:hypothetical protein n=1 Tax=Paenibacillus sp. FSL K6-1318 TaxID=2975291 RepID=UPI0030EF57D7